MFSPGRALFWSLSKAAFPYTEEDCRWEADFLPDARSPDFCTFSLIPLKTLLLLHCSSYFSWFPQELSEGGSCSFSFLPTRLNSVLKFKRQLCYVHSCTVWPKATHFAPLFSRALEQFFFPAFLALFPLGHTHLHTMSIPKANATSSGCLLWQHLFSRSGSFYCIFGWETPYYLGF